MVSEQEGVYVTHSRANKETETRFLVPRNENECNYAAILEEYVAAIQQGWDNVTFDIVSEDILV